MSGQSVVPNEAVRTGRTFCDYLCFKMASEKVKRNETSLLNTRRYADVRPDLWNVHAVEISVLGQIHLSPLAGSNRKWKLDIELLVINPQ